MKVRIAVDGRWRLAATGPSGADEPTDSRDRPPMTTATRRVVGAVTGLLLAGAVSVLPFSLIGRASRGDLQWPVVRRTCLPATPRIN